MSAKLVEAAVIDRVEKKRMALRTVVAVDVKELVYAAKAVDGKKLAEQFRIMQLQQVIG